MATRQEPGVRIKLKFFPSLMQRQLSQAVDHGTQGWNTERARCSAREPLRVPHGQGVSPALLCKGPPFLSSVVPRWGRASKGREGSNRGKTEEAAVCHQQQDKRQCVISGCPAKDRLSEMRRHRCVFAFRPWVLLNHFLLKRTEGEVS